MKPEVRRPSRAQGVVTAELPEGDVVLSTPDQSQAVIVNAMGGVVFDLCDGEHSIDDIADFIYRHVLAAGSGEAAGVEAPTRDGVREDVAAIVAQLSAAGLLVDVA